LRASTSRIVARFRRWFAEAARAGAKAPEAVALATAGPRGRPSVRMVLLKRVDERGFVFFTDAGSRKGRELGENPRAALTFYWGETGKQVRIEGRIERVSDRDADAYWQTRPRASQLAAAVSRQSAPVASRAVLLATMRGLARRLGDRAVPRPAAWTGFRLRPERVEFWIHDPNRLHHRELFVRGRSGWRRALLQP
jgi:pyridoxamine 5'-phosphate oxidase